MFDSFEIYICNWTDTLEDFLYMHTILFTDGRVLFYNRKFIPILCYIANF